MAEIERVKSILLPERNPDRVTVEKYYLMGQSQAPDFSSYAFPLYRQENKLLGLEQSPKQAVANLRTFFGVLYLIAHQLDKCYEADFRNHVQKMLEGHETAIERLFEDEPPDITEDYLLQLEPVRIQWSEFMMKRAPRQ